MRIAPASDQGTNIALGPFPGYHDARCAHVNKPLARDNAASMLGVQAAWAMLVMAASFLWSAAAVHIADMVRNKNFAINNAGPVFWWDILTPLTLLIALVLRAG